MNKKIINAIENILRCINELNILTKNKNDDYFYDGYEMPILCNLVGDIEKNLNCITYDFKNKYSNVNWNVINDLKNYDDGFPSLKIGDVWKLSSNILNNQLYHNLNKILEIELPNYYKNYCNKMHKKEVKNSLKNKK